MFVSVFLDFIYLLSPLMCYFLYLVYSKATFEEERCLFLDLAIFSSYYICSRFGDINGTFAFIINVPLLVALYKKRVIPIVVLSFCISMFLSNLYDVSFLFILLQYLLVFLLSRFTKYNPINIFVIVKVFFGIVIFFMQPKVTLDIKMVIGVMVLFVAIYLIYYLIVLFYKKVEKTVNMYYSLKDITREKKLYESLFKITHEIKNPLAVCKGYLDMFDIKNTKKANKYINIINQEIDRTLTLLKDFSDVSKINVEKNLMDITMLMEDVKDEVSLAFTGSIKFNFNIPNSEVLINGDYNRLKQVFINLIKNAKEAIEDSGMVILEGMISNNNYVINARDNGQGMDKETIKNIGTAFYTTKKNGTGLGVCLSKEIVERHGGAITYFSKLKKGTTVRVTLPIISKTSD